MVQEEGADHRRLGTLHSQTIYMRWASNRLISLTIRPFACQLSALGSRAFPIAGAKVWNSLPDDVTSVPSLSTFRRRLTTYLFRCCYNTD